MQTRALLVLTVVVGSAVLCGAIIVHDEDYQVYRGRNGDPKNYLPASEEQPRTAEKLNFHEVDAFGDDFVDFGAQTGPNGAFSWHANYPIEDKR